MPRKSEEENFLLEAALLYNAGAPFFFFFPLPYSPRYLTGVPYYPVHFYLICIGIGIYNLIPSSSANVVFI